MTTRERIDEFLRQRRIAVVGVSRNPREFSRRLWRDLQSYGFNAVPVNPHIAELDGARVFATVRDITPPVDAALVITAAAQADSVVRDCLDAGVTRIWLHLGLGREPLSAGVRELCHSRGIAPIDGFCPYMFLPQAGWFHHLHGFFARHSAAYKA